MMPNRQMSPELDDWVQRHTVAVVPNPRVRKEKPLPSPCPLTDAEFAWLWPRFQKCRFGGIRAAKSFARTSLERVTPRGKLFCLRMAFRHRTQLFGKAARKIGQDEFLGAIRTAAAKPPTTK